MSPPAPDPSLANFDLAAAAELVRAHIRDVPDFPVDGIIFKDITPVLSSHEALAAAIRAMTAPFAGANIQKVVGIEARGFIFGAAAADLLGCGFVPVRKPGKLPWRTTSISYELEYGTDTLEIHQDAASPGERVLVIDDLLATGGTMEAACRLLTGMGAEIVGCSFLIELGFLKGRDRLAPHPCYSLITY